jgi:hypothetical protein
MLNRYFGVWCHWSMEGYRTHYKCCEAGHDSKNEARDCPGYRNSGRLELVGVETGAYWEEE